MRILKTYGNEYNNDIPFVDLRFNNGIYTLNAIQYPYEYELVIGRRYTNKKLPGYIIIAISKLKETMIKCKDKNYSNSIKLKGAWEL